MDNASIVLYLFVIYVFIYLFKTFQTTDLFVSGVLLLLNKPKESHAAVDCLHTGLVLTYQHLTMRLCMEIQLTR